MASPDVKKKSRSLRNMKKLSLSSLEPLSPPPRHRRPSIISLPATTLHRREEDGNGSPSVPYADGPTQIIPGVWLGSEDNARDWHGLIERGIKSILNVAKEVASPFDSSHPLRSVSSTPNFRKARDSDNTYYPPHPATGRPAMHYLKLQWSHGQQDLVEDGFPAAMVFTDAAIERGEGVLIHCQCGISRSATMVIALVMRAAAERSPSVPSEIWALKGMQEAYSFVKEKSKWVGPNMSLIYQLLEYERKLKGHSGSPTPSERSSALADEEEEWGRRRRMLDEAPSDAEDERESTLIMREAQALDKAMEDRVVARKSSASSVASSGSGVGMGAAWRSRYATRKRAGSIASNTTNGSVLSEDLVEEEEEQELLGIGGGFDDDRGPSSHTELEESSATNSPDDEVEDASQRTLHFIPITPRVPTLRPPPSAPVWKTSFNIPPPPATAIRSTFKLPSQPNPKVKRRPPPLGALPPVPASPIAIIVEPSPPPVVKSRKPAPSLPPTPAPSRPRVESRKSAPPPLHLRNNMLRKGSTGQSSTVSTPSQTLFVFPPSPTLSTRTPSTMTLTSNMTTPIPFPSLSTPRVSSFRANGRTRSFIGLGAPPTPTTAFSKVDVRGYVGFD